MSEEDIVEKKLRDPEYLEQLLTELPQQTLNTLAEIDPVKWKHRAQKVNRQPPKLRLVKDRL